MEESMYRYVAHSYYYYIPNYMELTPAEENELREAGLRRITDTFLPEDESVRKILPSLEKLWRNAQTRKESHLWHCYFFQLFEHGMVEKDPQANEDDCYTRHGSTRFLCLYQDRKTVRWGTYSRKHVTMVIIRSFQSTNIRMDLSVRLSSNPVSRTCIV